MTSHVQVRAIPPRIKYVANGTMMEYEFPFVIFKTSDIDVYFNDKLQEKSTYTVSTIPDTEGGSIIFETPPINGTVITIFRNLSIERTTDFQEGGTLRAKVLNDEFDYQIACQQQIADSLNRSMVLPPYATDTDVDLTLPIPSAGKAIVWNKDGTNLENSEIQINEISRELNETLALVTEQASIASTAVQTVTEQTQNAIAQALAATTQAERATDQATLATQKAEETVNALSSRANVDLDNLTEAGSEAISSFCMPDYSAGVKITSNTNYTAPYNGFLIISVQSGAQRNFQVNINGEAMIRIGTWSDEADYRSITLPVAKNNVIRTDSSSAVFYPCIGG